MDQRLLSIYISSEVIRVVDATRKSATNITVNSVDEVSTPAGSFDDGYITDVLEIASAIRGKIIGKAGKAKAIFTISSKKINSVLNANSSEYFPMSTTGEFLFAYNVMETFQDDEGKKIRVNAVAAPKDLVEGYYEIADELKLSVYDIDYVGNSVQQLLKLQMSNNENDTNLVLQIEKDATFVNIMAGKDIILQRSVPYGKNAVINSIMEIKKLTEKEAIELLRDKDRMDRSVTDEEYSEAVRYLISSIGRIVEYHRSRNPERIIDGIKVFGEGASIAGIDEVLRQELGAEVTRFNTLNGIKVSQKSYLSADQALRFLACFGAVLNPIGLKIQSGKTKEASSAMLDKILYGVIALAAVVMIGVCAWYQIKFALKKADVEFKKSQINTLQIAEDIANQYDATLNAYNTVKTFTDTTHTNNVVLLQFIKDLENVMPTGTYVNDVSASDGVVSLKGYATSKEALADFIVQLKGLDYIASFNIPSFHVRQIDVRDEAEDEEGEESEIPSVIGEEYINTGVILEFDLNCVIVDKSFTAGAVETATDPSQVSDTTEGGEE